MRVRLFLEILPLREKNRGWKFVWDIWYFYGLTAETFLINGTYRYNLNLEQGYKKGTWTGTDVVLITAVKIAISMVLLTRRGAIKSRIASRNKILITISTGVVFLILPILIKIIDPTHVIVNYILRLAKGSTLYDFLQHEISGARFSIYMFNITNADRLLAGEDHKLKVEEVGPFVFQEYRWYEDLEISEDGKQMGMTPKFRAELELEASIGHPKDIKLTLTNLPLLSSVAMLSNYPNFINYAFNILATQIGAKAIIKMDVHDYLWGYKNPLVEICNSLVPGLVYFESLGLLDRLYDNQSDYRIVVGATNHDRFKIKSVKKFRRLQMGTLKDVDESEQIFAKDTYEGLGYPPMLTPDVPLNLFRVGICKTFNMEYSGSRITDYSGEAFVYTFGNKTFDAEVDPITLKPYPTGLMDISKCFYGLPFVLSKAHFLDSDPKLLERIDGLKPDRNVHVNEIVIDRKVSVTYNTTLFLQLSMMLGDLSFNKGTKMLSHLTVPIVNVKVEQPKMSEETMYKFALVYQVAPYIVLCVEIMSVLIGLAFIGHAVRLLYLNWTSTTKGMVFQNTFDKKVIKAEFPLISK